MCFSGKSLWFAFATALALTAGCPADDAGPADEAGRYLGQHVHTLLMGEADNAEVIKVVPGQDLALLVSSKGRQLTLLAIEGEELVILREVSLFEDDPTESELTHVDISDDGTWAVVTRTIIVTDGSEEQVDCSGELVFVDVSDSDTFGTILNQVEVGPMPDSVDISDNGELVASANERDGPDAWGKCEVAGEVPSISIIELSDGPQSAIEVARVEMIDGDTGPREPESVVFSSDNDLIAATLQDSHELVLLRASEIQALERPTSEDITIVSLPVNALGAGPWPDGVARFTDGAGEEYFATAGEWNDTFTVLEGTGSIVANVAIDAADLPASLPRVMDESSPLFSPDSIAPFHRGGRSYLAFSLRHSGAVAVYDVTDPETPLHAAAIAVGHDEQGGINEEGSTIRPEGIGAASDGSFIVSANEGESSVSLIVAVE